MANLYHNIFEGNLDESRSFDEQCRDLRTFACVD